MPISYAMAPPYSALAELMQTEPEKRPNVDGRMRSGVQWTELPD